MAKTIFLSIFGYRYLSSLGFEDEFQNTTFTLATTLQVGNIPQNLDWTPGFILRTVNKNVDVTEGKKYSDDDRINKVKQEINTMIQDDDSEDFIVENNVKSYINENNINDKNFKQRIADNLNELKELAKTFTIQRQNNINGEKELENYNYNPTFTFGDKTNIKNSFNIRHDNLENGDLNKLIEEGENIIGKSNIYDSISNDNKNDLSKINHTLDNSNLNDEDLQIDENLPENNNGIYIDDNITYIDNDYIKNI
jgi:hypothetical protein